MTGYESVGEQTIDYEEYLETYGLGPEDVETVVSYGQYVGTIGVMLANVDCPVGGKIKEAYAQGGLEAVEKKFQILSEFSNDFEFQISDSTRAFHKGMTDRTTLLATAPQEGNRDFLA